MKITFSVARVAVIAAVFLGLFAGIASAAQPTPGVDVKLGRLPSGKPMQATTDKAGRFVFDNLVAGQYVLSINAPRTTSAVNITGATIKHQSRVGNESQVVTASVLLGAGPALARIEITAAKGKIAGTVTRARAPQYGAATSGRKTQQHTKSDKTSACGTCHGLGTIVVNARYKCPSCEGSGRFLGQTCTTCHGSGYHTVNEQRTCPTCGGKGWR